MSGNHRGSFDLDSLHSKDACVTKCKGCSRFRKSKCSYRQQGYDKAVDNKTVYNYPAYKALCGDGDFKTGAYETAKGNAYPPSYAKLIAGRKGYWKTKPKPGEWDLGVKKNFKKMIKPYWHNYHHIVPASSLNNAIDSTGDTALGAVMPELIRGGLLNSKYTLHHKRNMIILPQGLNVAKALKLPRHLRGDELPGHDKQVFNHPDYNRKVVTELNSIMADFKQEVAKSLEGKAHPELPDRLAVAKLKYLSMKLNNEIIGHGKFLFGKSLDEMSNSTLKSKRS